MIFLIDHESLHYLGKFEHEGFVNIFISIKHSEKVVDRCQSCFVTPGPLSYVQRHRIIVVTLDTTRRLQLHYGEGKITVNVEMQGR